MRSALLTCVSWVRTKSKLLTVLVGGILVGGVTIGTAVAIIPDDNGVIHACYKTSGPANGPTAIGTLRIINSPAQSCESNESPISWDSAAASGGSGLGQLVTDDFSNANLEEFDMRYRNFDGIDFTNANLARAKLSHSGINGANFTGANLSSSSIIQQDLSGANLTNTKLQRASISAGTFGATTFSGTDFFNAQINAVAGLDGRDFRTGVTVLGVRFVNTNLTGANFAGLEFTKVSTSTFDAASRAVFDQSNLTNVDFTGIKSLLTDTGITFTNNNLTNTKFVNAVLTGGINQNVFNGSTGTDTDFTGADLRGSEFRNVNLTNPNFTNANLAKGTRHPAASYAAFGGATLTNANFTNANLSQAIELGSATLINPIWSNTTCPDGSNSDLNGGTCVGHF